MIKIKWTEERKTKAIEMLDEYFAKHGFAESIMQSDTAQIQGLDLLCEIADVLIDDESILHDED
jgi:hypothetical protein